MAFVFHCLDIVTDIVTVVTAVMNLACVSENVCRLSSAVSRVGHAIRCHTTAMEYVIVQTAVMKTAPVFVVLSSSNVHLVEYVCHHMHSATDNVTATTAAMKLTAHVLASNSDAV